MWVQLGVRMIDGAAALMLRPNIHFEESGTQQEVSSIVRCDNCYPGLFFAPVPVMADAEVGFVDAHEGQRTAIHLTAFSDTFKEATYVTLVFTAKEGFVGGSLKREIGGFYPYRGRV